MDFINKNQSNLNESKVPLSVLLIKLILKRPTYCLVIIATILTIIKTYFIIINYQPSDNGVIYSKLKMQSILIKEKGDNSIIYIGSTNKPIARDFEVLVKVKAFGINHMDILQRQGKLPPNKYYSNIMGMEVAGTITEIGKDVKNFKVGDKVCGLIYGGGYSEYAVIHHNLLMKIPNGLSLEQGAAIPEAFLTAYHTLFNIGNIKQDDNILINSIGSGVEDSIIQLSKYFKGNKITVLTDTYDKVKYYEKIGVKAINYIQETKIHEKVLKGIKGVDIIIDNLGVVKFYDNIKMVNKNAKYILLNNIEDNDVQLNLDLLIKKSIQLQGFQLMNLEQQLLFNLVQQFNKNVLNKLDNKNIKVNIDKTFSWIDIEEAHQYLEKNLGVAKIIAVID